MPRAIQCFQRQIYPNLELLLAYNGEHLMPEALDEFSDLRVQVVHVPFNNRIIGDKRNVGCEIAKGEFICHFDDDDWSHPERVARQIATLQSSGKAVTGYHSMKFTDGTSWWQYVGSNGYVLGTSLCYRRDWWTDHRFDPTLQCGEDGVFVTDAVRQRQLISEPDLDLMYATIHPGNTSHRGVKRETCWKPLHGFQWRAA